mgnify:CR=1 FL=1
MTSADAEALTDPFNAPSLVAVAPVLNGSLQVAYGENATNLTVTGTNSQHARVRNLEAVLGGLLTEADLADQARVAVLGWAAYSELFTDGDYPVGQTITIDGVQFEVVGVLKEQGGLGNEDDSVYVPLTTAQSRFFTQRTLSGEQPVAAIYASVADDSQVDAAIKQITSLLRERHNLASDAPDDFQVTSQQAILDIAGAITGILTIFLGAIAGISLLVGGIGIMNIMLVSVTERTREIGIRKALGARRRDILAQFLTEAVILSGIGGVLGFALGWAASRIISSLGTTTVIAPATVILALGFSVAVGVFFGIYPANKASRMDPIQALHFE